MFLSKPFGRSCAFDFDELSGEVRCETCQVSPIKGVLEVIDGCCVALYCKDGQLIFQIDKHRWPLSSDDVVLSYFHDFSKKITTFKVEYPNGVALLEYEGWWASIPDFEYTDPEQDEDEDFLGYVFEVWKNKKLQESLVKKWG